MDKNARKVDDVQIIRLSVELCLLLLKFIKIFYILLFIFKHLKTDPYSLSVAYGNHVQQGYTCSWGIILVTSN